MRTIKEYSNKTRRFYLTLAFMLILLYGVWWTLYVYVPFNKKRSSLIGQISVSEKEIRVKEETFMKVKEAQEQLQSSLSRVAILRSGFPHLGDIDSFTALLKKKGNGYNLRIETNLPDTHIHPSPLPSESMIHSVPLTMSVKGNFLSMGRYIAALEEENRQFCHIKDISIERPTRESTDILATIKMDVYFQKTGGNGNEIL